MFVCSDKKLEQQKKQHYIYSHEDTYFCKVRKDSKFEELQRLRSAVLPGSIELLMDG